MIALIRDTAPLSLVLLVGTLVVLLLLRSRASDWGLAAGLLLCGVGVEAACFDGRPHLTEKFDATFFVFCRAVEFRILAGAQLVILAAPLGEAAGRWVGRRRGWAGGLLVFGSFGLSLLASGILVFISALAALLSETPPAERLELLRQAIRSSSIIVGIGGGVAALAAAGLGVELLRGRDLQGEQAR